MAGRLSQDADFFQPIAISLRCPVGYNLRCLKLTDIQDRALKQLHGRRIPAGMGTRLLLLDVLHAGQVFEMLVLRPQGRLLGAGGGKDDAVCQRKFVLQG